MDEDGDEEDDVGGGDEDQHDGQLQALVVVGAFRRLVVAVDGV